MSELLLEIKNLKKYYGKGDSQVKALDDVSFNVYKGEIPEYFIRKQTLTNAERYTTKELDELQSVILSAEDRLAKLELMRYNYTN